MFRGIVEAKPFRSLIEFIRQIVSEVRVKVDHGGWLIEFIDPANITAGQVKLNSDNWGEYYLEDTMIFGLDLARLVDILPIFENYIQVEVAEYEIRLKEGNITYTCALIDPEAIRRVKLRLDELYKQVRRGAFVVITYNLLRDLIRTATSEYLYLEASEDNIILFNGHLKVTTEEEYENILDYGIEEPTKAIYRIDYLKPLLKLKTDHFYIFFREKHPCYITTEVGHFDVIYTVAPRIPDEEGYRAYAPKEVEFEYETEIDISRYKKGILRVKPNYIYIKGHKIYFMYYHRNAPVYHYTAVERDYPFVKEGLYSINDISDIIKPVDEITLGFTNDKLYINGIEVGSKVADELDIVEPDPTFEEIEIGAGDLKYLLRGLKHWDPLAVVCDNGELKLMSKPHEGEIREISVLGSCRGKGVIRALESWELLTPLGDVVRIYYKEDLNEPVIVVYIKQVKKPIREEIDMVYSVFLPSPEERELIDEVNEIFGVEVKEEKPPEKTDFEKLTEELRRYNPPYTYPPLDLRKKAEEFLENLLKEHGLDKYNRFYYYHRYIPSKERLIELLLMGWINGWDPRERITHVKPCEELSEKPPYFIDSWVVRYVPSDKVFQFSYTVNGLRGFPLYFDSLEEVNEFLEKGKGEVYIPQERETGIAEWKPARIPRLFKFKVDEVIDTPTATYTLEQPLVKSDNPDVWVWQVAVWDKVKHEDRREYLTEDEIEKLKSTFEEKPKHTPSLEDILAELEPLGYRERWRVVESLKAKGFEDVGETIDKFIKEGELRKVGKYIEAMKGVWEEHEKKVAEEKEKPKEEEKIYVLILRPTATIETSPEEYRKVWELTKDYMFKLYEIDKLPKGFKLKPSAFGDPFLVYEYDGKEIAFGRCYFTKKGNRWFNLTHNSFENPEDIIAEYQGGLGKEYEDVEKAWNSTTTEKRKEWLEKTGETREWVIDFSSQLDWEMLDDWERKKLIPIIREELKKKLPAEEKPKEEKPPAKPPAEPYNFILEKLRSTFLAELELAGLSEEEAERELEAIMFEIERLAKDVVEGKLSQIDAVKEIIKKARTITRPTEVAPPEEVKIVKEEKPRRIRRAEEIWKERRVELPAVGVPTVKPEELIKKFNPILGLSSFESELEQDQAMMVLPPYIAKKGEEIQKREGDLLIPLSASFVMINYPKTLVEHGVEKATYIAFPTLWRKIGEVPFIELIPPEVELEYRDVIGKTGRGKFTRRDLLENAINYYLCKVFGLSDSEIPDKWRVSYEYLKSLNELIR